MSASFREVFLSGGQAPPPGLLTRRPDLAAVLDAVAHQGISAFYSGNLTREMAAAVRRIVTPDTTDTTDATDTGSGSWPLQFEASPFDSLPVLQVQASGGVLQEEDFANYSSILLQPAEVTYQGKGLLIGH